MNKQQLELLDEAYKNWFKKGRTEFEEFADPMFMSEDALGEEKFHKISKEYFIEQIKTDTEFSERWGLKIEERELSHDERFRIAYKNLELRKKLEAQSKMLHYPDGHNKVMDDANIPTKLITITYNDKTIESYE
jgi:hypothetical protein